MKKKTLVALLVAFMLLAGINTEVIAHVHDEHAELFKTVVVKDGTDLDTACSHQRKFKKKLSD